VSSSITVLYIHSVVNDIDSDDDNDDDDNFAIRPLTLVIMLY